MAQLNVRLDDHTRDALDALARGRGVTASELIRDLIDQSLGREAGGQRSADPAPSSMSAVERRGLALQHEALSMLTTDPDQAHHHRKMMSVLNEGFVSEYSDAFAPMQPELPPRECELLQDIFQMFRTLEPSLEALTEDDRVALGQHAEHALVFRGFDFNDNREARLATYAEYLISDRRWEERAGDFGDGQARAIRTCPCSTPINGCSRSGGRSGNRRRERSGAIGSCSLRRQSFRRSSPPGLIRSTAPAPDYNRPPTRTLDSCEQPDLPTSGAIGGGAAPRSPAQTG